MSFVKVSQQLSKQCWPQLKDSQLSVFSYPGGENSCCSSCGHSWCTVLPPPPLGTGTVRSSYRTHPLAQCRGCHTHTADSPGSFAAPGCGNRDDKCHSDGLRRVPKIERRREKGQKEACM